jgi:hypothetical protein
MQAEHIQIDPALPQWRQEQLAMMNAGRDYVRQGELGKWSLGDLALRWSSKWDRTNSLIDLAKGCKMPFPRLIYEYADTSETFDESARAHIYEYCPNVTWSHCREVARYCKRTGADKEDAMDKIVMANDNHVNVQDLAKQLRDDPDGDYVTKRQRIEATITSSSVDENEIGHVSLIVPKDLVQRIQDLQQQRGFRAVLTLVWDEQRV